VRRTGRRDLHQIDRALLIFCLAVLGLAVVYPILRLVVVGALEWDNTVFRQGPGLRVLWNTLGISFATVLVAGVWGTALAGFVYRYRFPGRNALAVLAYLPFTLPPLVGVLSFYYIIGRDGFIPRFLEQYLGWENAALPGVWAILLIHAYSFYVFFYAMTSAALANLDRAQVEAARSLGAGPWRAFFRVTLPQLTPSIKGAALLTFMSSNASFSAPYFFGQDFPMLSVEIFYLRSRNDDAGAVTLTLILAAMSLLGLLLFRGRPRPSGAVGKGVRVPIRSGAGKILVGVGVWVLMLLLLLPHITILWLAFTDYRAWHTEIVPFVFTLDNFTRLYESAHAFAPIRNSIWTSALATAGALVVGLPAAYLYGRRRRGGQWLNLLVMLPWALPGTVIAINLIVAFNDPWLPLYNTIWLLPLAYFVRNVPLLARMSAAAIESFDGSLTEAGQTLGGSPAYCFRRIVVPLMAPALAAATALCFATSLGEFVASILIYVPANVPISVKINMEWRSSVGAAFAYSSLLMVLVALSFALARRFSGRLL